MTNVYSDRVISSMRSKRINPENAVNKLRYIINSAQDGSGGDIAHSLAVFFRDPVNVLAISDPMKLAQIEQVHSIYYKINITFWASLLCICILRFILMIPADIEMEKRERRRDFVSQITKCYDAYNQNKCNSTNSLLPSNLCLKFEACFKNEDDGTNELSFYRYFWELKDLFFQKLSPKSAIFLGCLCAVVLFVSLKK